MFGHKKTKNTKMRQKRASKSKPNAPLKKDLKCKQKQSVEPYNELPIGQTLETKDKYLPFNKKTSQSLKDSRPVIIVEKQKNPQGKEEYAIIPGSTQDTHNTTEYRKHGIRFYRHNLEVRDSAGQPIMQNDKFKATEKSSQLPRRDVEKMKEHVLHHTKQSSENQRKMHEFQTRYQRKKEEP